MVELITWRKYWIFLPLAVLIAVALLVPTATAATASAEQGVVVRGQLEVRLADNFKTQTATWRYSLRSANGATLRLNPGRLAAKLQGLGGEQVSLEGSQDNGTVKVSDVTSEPRTLAAALLSSAPTAKKTAVILVNFQNDTSTPWTQDQVRSVVFTNPDSVNNYYQEQSTGQLSLTGKTRADGDVFGYYTIPYNNTGCQYDLLGRRC